MEAKLTAVVEKRLEEKREYMSLLDATKDIDFGLYQKMTSAGVQRRNSLYDADAHEIKSNKNNENNENKENNCLQPLSNNNINTSNHLNVPNMSKTPQPLRRCKSASQKKRKSKRISRSPSPMPRSPCPPLLNDDNNTVEQDEEEVALRWAHSILVKEFDRRCEIRDKNHGANKRVCTALSTLHTFKQRHEEKIQKELTKKKERARKKEAIGNPLKNENSSNGKDMRNDLKQNENAHTKQTKIENSFKREKKVVAEIKKDDQIQPKFEVMFLKDQIKSKKRADNNLMVNHIFTSTTEKEKIEEAKIALNDLNVKAERKKMRAIKNVPSKFTENYNNDKERIISDGNIGEDGQENESGKFASLEVLL